MNLWDKLLRLFGTNRVQLAWRWRRRKEGWDRPGKRVSVGGLIPEEFPLVSALLLGACVVFYFLTVKLTNDVTGETGYDPAPLALLRYGAAHSTLVVVAHEWWRLLTANFLHGGLLHLVMNALGLWVVGNALEEHFGRARALAVFVVSGAVGMFVSVTLRPALVVGASAGIFGMMGCLVAHALRHRGTVAAQELRARFVPWLIYGLIIGFAVPGVDNLAHLGGLFAGGALGMFLGDARAARRVRGVWEAMAVLALLAVAGAFVLAMRSPYIPG